MSGPDGPEQRQAEADIDFERECRWIAMRDKLADEARDDGSEDILEVIKDLTRRGIL